MLIYFVEASKICTSHWLIEGNALKLFILDAFVYSVSGKGGEGEITRNALIL